MIKTAQILFVFIFINLCFGNEYRLKKLTFKGITEREQVIAFYQDSNGKLWAATDSDILQFNGKRWRRLSGYNNQSQVNKTFATDIIEWEHSVWISSRERLIAYDIETLEFIQYEHDYEDETSLIRGEIWSTFIDNENKLWLGSYYGISHFDNLKQRFNNYYFPKELSQKYSENLNTALCWFNKGDVIFIATVSGHLIAFNTQNKSFSAISKESIGQVFQCEAKEQSLWLATETGVWQFDASSQQVFHVINDNQAVLSILFVDNDFLYSTRNALFLFSDASKSVSRQSELSVKSLFLDQEGTVWATTESGGIFSYSPSANKFGLELLHTDSYVQASQLINVNEEHWIATNNGIKVLSNETVWLDVDKRFSHIYSGQNSVIAVAGDVVIWFDKITKKKNRVVNVKELKNKGMEVTSLVEDYTGRVWMALSSFDYSRLLKIESADLKFSEYDLNDPMYLNPFDWLHVTINPQGDRLYVDTNANYPRIYHVDSKEFIKLKYSDGLILNTRKIQSDGARHWTFHDDFRVTYFDWPDEIVPSQLTSSENASYISAENSSSTIDKEHNSNPNTPGFRQLLNKPNIHSVELPIPGVICIASLDLNLYWMVDRQGVLWSWNKEINTLERFNQLDGIPMSGLDGNYCHIDNNQQMKLTASNYLVTLDINRIQKNTKAPNVGFERVIINRQPIENLKNQTVYAKEGDDIVLNGRNSSYAAIQKNQWYWSLSSNEGEKFFSENSQFNLVNARAGYYQLTLRASNNDGKWSNDRSLTFQIAPPFWRSNLAFFMYFFLLLIFLFSYFLWSNYQRKKLSQMVETKTHEITQLLAQKERLFTGISHEFRTPLTLIQASVERLHALKLSSTTAVAEKLKYNAAHLLRLVEELLDFSLVKQSKADNRSIDISSITESIVHAFSELALSKKITIQTDIKEKINVKISYDAYEKILSNLIHNGIKYNREGGHLMISVSQLDANEAEINIKDTGVGMSEHHLTKIFEPLYRINENIENKIVGTGIGLALVKELVEKYQGSIDVHSEIKKGTSFYLRLPLINQNLSPSNSTQGMLVDEAKLVLKDIDREWVDSSRTLLNKNLTTELKGDSGYDLTIEQVINTYKPPNINASQTDIERKQESAVIESKNIALIVEDNPDLRAFIVESIQPHFTVISASNGVQALEIANEQIPDIIVSDIMMPSMDGFQMLEKIRSNDVTSHIPVILLTAKTDVQSRLKGWSETADDFMTKPFSSEELVLRMQSLISLREILKLRYRQLNSNHSSDIESRLLTNKEPFLERVESILNEHYAEQSFKVPQLASECRLSERQVQRKIKAVTGQSASDFIRTFRLTKAYDLISLGASVKEAALSTGFSSMPYFSKCFKSLYDISPSEVIKGKPSK